MAYLSRDEGRVVMRQIIASIHWLTLKEIAIVCGIAERTIYKYLSGERRVPSSVVALLKTVSERAPA